ncbi:hypothetical protein QJS10_CPB20g00239 [Acorus calamus]|uniref:Uncharacterized protein n=1 Tax=Acorus calamus TaxID=4465 RepID=A0AAV9CAR4_ACOCL|nr:hypothetical protein QJS10_CPB20g00239 [Acorus calamus]
MELEGRLTMTLAANPDQLDIWVLQDLYGGGWRKKHSIKFDSLKGLLHHKFDYRLIPALFNNDVMIFQCTCGCSRNWQAYDIKRGEGCAIEGLKTSGDGSFKVTHTNSLVRWSPCKCGCFMGWQAYDIKRGEGCAIEGIMKSTGGLLQDCAHQQPCQVEPENKLREEYKGFA